MSVRLSALLELDSLCVRYDLAKDVLLKNVIKQGAQLEVENSCNQIRPVACLLMRSEVLCHFFALWIHCHRDKQVWPSKLANHTQSVKAVLMHVAR